SHISKQVEIIRNYNPSWQGLISVNLRGIKPESFRVVKNNKNIDILEINAHCRQEAVVKAGAGEGLLKDKKRLSQVLDEVSSYDMDVSVKIRANVCGVDILEITKLIDATNPGIMEADYEIIEEVSNNTEIHLIGNNSVTTHDDYMKMINSGADSVSVARAALNGNIQDIFY
ncbi:tRNA-dihydrouridine synthase, partial [Methanosphaera stadtmanae]|uniref:tRNA-dihydrouridine synthase n=1 Tax=Methanosphaera stadtmanae TaxID=2317 RepID=UPI0026667221